MAVNRSLIKGFGQMFSTFLPSTRNKRRSQRRRMRTKLRTPHLEMLESRVLLSVYWVDDVASNGDGSSASPYSTISAAAIVAVAGDTVNIRTGVYRETVNPLNSGTTVSPITYQAIDGAGTVTIKGTDILGTTGNDDWAQTAGQTYYETTTMNWTQGIGNDQIFVNDQMMLWARWPNNTSLDVSAATSSSTWENIDSVVSITDNADNSRRLTFTDAALGGNAANWVGGYIQLLPGRAWVGQSGVVVAGSTNNTLIVDILSMNFTTDANVPVAGNSYYLTGKLSALDSNGEWFRDAATGKLYLSAPVGVDPDTVTVEAKARDTALNLDGKSNLIFDGINIFGANVTTSSTSQNMIFRDMDIKYASHYDLTTVGPWTGATTWSTNGWTFGTTDTGVVLDGAGHLFENSTIQYSAGNGITLLGNNIKILNNTILDTDYMATDASAIFTADGSTILNAEIAYNTIGRSGRSGIILRGTKASNIHHNDVARAMLQTSDGGGLSSFMNDSQGTIIAYNTIHDIYAMGDSSSTLIGVGIHLDNGSANYTLHHNVVWNTLAALRINTYTNDQNHQILQNTFIGDDQAVVSWGKPGSQNMVGTELRNNVLVGSISVYDPSIIKASNFKYASKNAVPPNVFTDMSNGDLTLPFGSLASKFGEDTTDVRPFSFGYTGAAPSAGALDIGQAMFTTGRQAGVIDPNNRLLGLTVNSGVTLLSAGQYDTLGQGISYSDNQTANLLNQNTGGTWRLGEGVDASASRIAYIETGEWVEYTLDIQMAGTYTLDFQTNGTVVGSFVAKIGDGETFTSLGTVNVANSGTSRVWTTPALNVTLQKGVQVLRLEFASGGYSLYDIRLTSKQQPYGGLTTIPASGATTILAGSYDLGGEGVAYHDSDAVNIFSQPTYNETFRTTEGVDARPSQIAFIMAGEWLEYTVNVASAGTYKLSFETQSSVQGAFDVAIGDGQLFSQVGSVSVPITSSKVWTATPLEITLQPGVQVLRLNFAQGGFSLTQIKFENPQTPYGSLTTVAASGVTTIASGSYDEGGEGFAYHDSDAVNIFSQPDYNETFRTTEGVDARASQIAFITPGEWLEYTVDVTSAGTYKLSFETQSNVQGAFDVEIGDGQFFSQVGSVSVPITSSRDWAATPLEITLQAGVQVLRLNFTQGGFSLTQIKFENPQTPYGSLTTIAASGATTIASGSYDLGGEMFAYHDWDAVNIFSQPDYNETFRTTEGVDARASQIAFIRPGEWLEYTVNVASAGTYTLSFETAGTKQDTIDVGIGDGQAFNTVGSVTVLITSSKVWTTPLTVSLQAGEQVLRLNFTRGGYSLYQIQFTYLSALEAASTGVNTLAAALSVEQLNPIFTEATDRWQRAGFDVSAFNNVKWVVADLPDNLLGATDGKTIYLDTNAANWGWFIDSTPRDDSEFYRPGNQGEEGRMDLLSVVTHELGHVLGLEHDTGWLSNSLTAGTRDTPILAPVDFKLLPIALSHDQARNTLDKPQLNPRSDIHWWQRDDLRLTYTQW